MDNTIYCTNGSFIKNLLIGMGLKAYHHPIEFTKKTIDFQRQEPLYSIQL